MYNPTLIKRRHKYQAKYIIVERLLTIPELILLPIVCGKLYYNES